jgi:ubiquinol-cytochrome c reductase subunit 7
MFRPIQKHPVIHHSEEHSEQSSRSNTAASETFLKMFSRLSAWFVNPRRNPLARLHRDAVAARLRKYGLRYDDLYDPYHDLDIREALARLPREVVDARNARLKRAMDLSMKHQYLPEDVQALQTPFRSYLSDMLALVKKESAEREALGALPLYQRTIP